MPVMPDAAKQNTPDGAAAFARHFFDVVNFALQTPRTGVISALSTPECKSCAALEDGAADFVARGRRYGSAPFEVATSDAGHTTTEGRQTVIVTGTQLPAAVVAGTETSSPVPKKHLVRQLHLAWQKDGWRVDAIKGIQ